MCIFFAWNCCHEIWIFSIFGVYLFSRMAFKRKFCVHLILRNQAKFEKFAKICTRKISTHKVDKNRKLPFKLLYLPFTGLVSFRLYLHLFCSIFPESKFLTFVFVRERGFLETACVCNICSNCELLNIKSMDISSSWKVYLALCHLLFILAERNIV